MNPLARLGIAARRGFGRVTPDPFVLASGLTMLTLALALVFGETDAGPSGVAALELSFAWTGSGVWNLLAFSMQACVMLVLGTALAETPVFQRLIRRLVGVARTPRALVGLTAGVAIALGADIPSDFELAAAMSMSDDGRVICGWGYTGLFFFQDAWIVVLPGGDEPCPGDFNGDGIVNGADLGLMLVAWGTEDPVVDLSGDGRVDGADLGLLLAFFGDCP